MYSEQCSDSSLKVHRTFHDNSTLNLNHHVHTCKAAADNNNNKPRLVQSSLMPFMQGSTYTPGHLHVKQVKLAARNHMPYFFIKYKEYHDILQMFNKDVRLFSANTLSCDVKDVYALVKKRVSDLLQVCQPFQLLI